MNNNGELIGYRYTEDSVYSYFWRNGRATPLQDMRHIGSSGTDVHDVYALGINDAGIIVGHAYQTDYRVRNGIVWSSQDAQPTPLPQPGMFGQASVINNKGTVGGTFYEVPGSSRDAAVLWSAGGHTEVWHANAGDPNGRLEYHLSGYDTGIVGINEHDHAVGYVETPHIEDVGRPGHWSKRRQAIFWDGEQSHLLASSEAGWEFTNATAINDDGVIVGIAGLYDPEEQGPSTRRAVSWADGAMHFLDGTDTAEFSHASDVNNLGWIVGGIDGDAVLWLDGQTLRLDSLLDGTAAGLGSFDLQGALFVNDRGQILASGLLNGTQRYAILTPVPEPSTMALAFAGLAVLTWRARKAATSRGQA